LEFENPEEVLIKDFMSMRMERIELLKRIESNISSFIRHVEKRRDEVIAKLDMIKATITDDRRGAVILDPSKKMFSIVRIEPLDEEGLHPIVYIVRMEPPYIPHFFLTIAYIYLAKKLIPSTLMRTHPVVSLISLVTKGDRLTATVSWLTSNIVLLEHFMTGIVSVFPYKPSLLDLPVESDTIYLTNIGYSTEPLENLDLNIKLDLSDVPSIPDDVLSKLNFRSYRSVLDEVLDEVIL